MTDFFVYETLPYRFTPRTMSTSSAFHPYDNFDTLTRSMREVTRYADYIARALADPKHQEHETKHIENTQHSDAQQSLSNQAVGLLLRPSIDWKETTDGFVLTAATPGLRKDELKVELLETSGVWYIEVAGQTAVSSGTPKDESQAAKPEESPKPFEVRTTYRSFIEKVRLPQGVDREAMRATYEDGLLVVTMPRSKADMKREKIEIN
jgi:HSP20 family molecular chaperone IbpA